MAATLDVYAERRRQAGAALHADARAVTAACRDMARRFLDGGRLIVFGGGGCAADAAHVSVEFVHPVIVGKRALPALALTDDVASLTSPSSDRDDMFAAPLLVHGRAGDIALGISRSSNDAAVRRALHAARERGLLTIALTGGLVGPAADAAVDHVLVARSDDPRVIKEIHVTTYHLLWELVHVFLDQQAGARR